MYAPFLSPIHATCTAYASILVLITQIKFGEEYRTQLLLMLSSLLPCYLVPLTLKYIFQRPIFEHREPVFLPQCQRPSFTSIRNNRQDYILYIVICMFLNNKLEDKRFCTEC
jgi:hypothetical protein